MRVGGRTLVVIVALVWGGAAAMFVAAPATAITQTTGDEPHYLLTAQSLWSDRSLDVSDERAQVDYLAFHDAPLRLQERLQADGSMVSPHDPGLAFLLAAPMGIGGWAAAKATMALIAAALGGVLHWIATRRLGVGERRAAAVLAVLGASAPFAVYGAQVYPEIVAALLVAIAVGLVTGPVTRSALVAIAAVIVGLPWLSVKYAPVAVVVAAIAALWQWRSPSGLRIWWAALLAVSGALFALAHLRWYGGLTPYAAGNHFDAGELTVMGASPDYAGRTGRIVGLLVDRDFGIAVWQPAFVLIVPAIVAVITGQVAQPLRAFLAVLGAGWFTATFLALTMHGWWFPGRQVIVALPIAALAITAWAAVSKARMWWTVGLGTAGVTTAVWLACDATIGGRSLVIDPFDTAAPALQLAQSIAPDLRSGDAALLAGWTVTAIAAGCVPLIRTVAMRRASLTAKATA
jgi:hypothetical protein